MLESLKLWWHSRNLKNPIKAKRLAAVRALAHLHNPMVIEALLPALDDKEAAIRHAAALALGEFKDIRGVKPLMQLVESDPSEDIREAAALSLGRMGDKQASRVLAKALGDPDPDIRIAAAQALAKLGEARWQDWVKGTENDFNELAQSSERRAMDALILALGNDKLNVRLTALEGLGRLGGSDVVPPLLNLLNDQDQRVRIATIGWLVKLRDRRAIGPLLQSLRHKDGETRLAAVKALAEWGEPRAIPDLRLLMEDPYDNVCRAVVEALTRLAKVAAEAPPGHVSGLAKLAGGPQARPASGSTAAPASRTRATNIAIKQASGVSRIPPKSSPPPPPTPPA